jgi:hypothetical protein
MKITNITFPKFSGIRCLMMPFIQGDPQSIPYEFRGEYDEIIKSTYLKKGDIGYLTIDESDAIKGSPHRGARSKYERALHTEAGRHPDMVYAWGGGGWGSSHRVTLEPNVEILLANNVDNSCALWDTTHEETTMDGDIGHLADEYPYSKAIFMKAGEVHKIGILTPHESIPVKESIKRQFLRIVGSGVNGREEYFTINPLLA